MGFLILYSSVTNATAYDECVNGCTFGAGIANAFTDKDKKLSYDEMHDKCVNECSIKAQADANERSNRSNSTSCYQSGNMINCSSY